MPSAGWSKSIFGEDLCSALECGASPLLFLSFPNSVRERTLRTSVSRLLPSRQTEFPALPFPNRVWEREEDEVGYQAMSDPIITLTTDFGEESPYVAAMKGVILGINRSARILDLSHQIPPQNLAYAAYFLSGAVPHFPPDALHVIVVDPGVGTERALLYVEVAGHRLLVPDNGCWTELISLANSAPLVLRLAEPRYWRHPVSATFHGRDILASVAGHLSVGADPRTLGPQVEAWVRCELPKPTLEPGRLAGEVLFVDHFGNLITNIPGESLAMVTGTPRIQVAGQEIWKRVRSYAEAEPGTAVALVSSNGMLEIAVTNGNAAQQMDAQVGSPVLVTPAEHDPSPPASGSGIDPGAALAMETFS